MTHFLPVLWVFPGHFLSGAEVSPGFVAFPGTFSFCGGGLSWFWRYFRDVLLLWGILSWFWGCFRDILRQE
jgi:hypothetical protein